MLNNKKTIGKIEILLSAILWGFISIFSLPLNKMGFDSLKITFMRAFLSVFFLGIYILIKNKKLLIIDKKGLLLSAILGVVCFFLLCSFYTLSIERNGSSLAVMLQFTAPIWSFIMARIIYKENIGKVKLLALFGVLTGCVLTTVSNIGSIEFLGVIFGLLTGVFFALSGLVSKLFDEKYNRTTITFYMFVFATLPSFLLGKGWEIPSLITADKNSILYLLGIAFFATTLAYILYNDGINKITISTVSIISTFEIVVATLIGIIVFNDEVSFLSVIGLVVLVVSLILAELPKKMNNRYGLGGNNDN